MSIRKLISYLNPIDHLGERQYSLLFPLFATIAIYSLSELFGFFILRRPNDMGTPDVILTFVLVLYFAFRSGIPGGLIATGISIVFFAYFIYSRQVPFAAKETAIETAATLTVVYIFMMLIVGWLKQTLDTLLEKEKQARIAAEHEQKRLQTLIELVPVGIGISDDPQGGKIKVNKLLRQMLHLKSGQNASHISSERRKLTYSILKDGKKVPGNLLPIQKAGISGKPVIGEELEIVGKNGSTKSLVSYAVPLFDERKKVRSVVGAFLDITERKQIEKQKDDFIAMVSHELKTPLTSIKVFTQVLQKRFEHGKDQESLYVLTKMNENVNSLSELIKSLLDVTRIQQGKILVENEPFRLQELIEDIIEDVQPITHHKILYKPKINITVYGDRERVKQVLVNLITNAIKYSPRANRVIVGSQKKKNLVEIFVQDFGIGISQAEQKKVFERFYQADAHKTYPGLGLGLYISSEIIRANGGTMWVKSIEKKGSTFYFTLPISS